MINLKQQIIFIYFTSVYFNIVKYIIVNVLDTYLILNKFDYNLIN